jgi:DNA-binding response OmpR family regulator
MATILVSESEADIRDVMTRLFRRAGHHVHTTVNGRDTLTHALATPPDLLVMNPALPGLDGLQVCGCLRADCRTRRLPILMLSVHQYPAERAAARDAGADDYLGKPFETAELIARADRLLRKPVT